MNLGKRAILYKSIIKNIDSSATSALSLTDEQMNALFFMANAFSFIRNDYPDRVCVTMELWDAIKDHLDILDELLVLNGDLFDEQRISHAVRTFQLKMLGA